MMQVNLIPAHRLAAQRRTAKLRLWTTICLAYAVGLLLTLSVTQLVTSADQRIKRRLVDVESQIKLTQQQTLTARQTLRDVEERLQVVEQIGKSPDWSILLNLLSQTVNEKAVLRRIGVGLTRQGSAARGLTPVRLTGATEPTADNSDVIITIAGYAQNHQDVSRVAMALESLGLFESVKVLEARRETRQGMDVATFNLICIFADGQEAQP